MGRNRTRRPLLAGLLGLAAAGAPAQQLSYDHDILAERLSYDSDVIAGRLSYDFEGFPGDAVAFDPAVDEGALTILGVSINGRDLGETTVMAVRGGTALVPLDDLRRWRLVVPGATAREIDGQLFAPLDAVVGLVFRVDGQRQLLMLEVPGKSFEATTLALGVKPPAMSPAARTAFLNYDLSLDRVGGESVGSAFLEAGVSGEPGLAVSTMTLGFSEGRRRAVRLDSYAIHDDPGGLTRLVLGDTLTHGASWSPQVRYAGLRYGTDFTLQPGFLSFPTPIFNGQAALPSDVEVYVNDVLRYQTRVDQGPFGLEQLPLLAGSGKVALQVDDALGLRRTVVANYYVSTRLLRRGLSEYSLELGSERRAYGSRSFDYGRSFAAGSYRYGVAGWLTAEGRAELAQDLQMFGGGLSATAGSLGEFGGAVAGSRGAAGSGILYRLYAARVSPSWSINASYQNASANYSELGDTRRADRPRTILQIGAGITLGDWGNFSGSESMIRRLDGVKSRITMLNYSRRLYRYGNITGFFANSRQSAAADVTTVGLGLSVALGGNRSLYAQVERGNRRIEMRRSLPTDTGWGYRLLAEDGVRDQQQAEIAYRGRALDISGQFARADGTNGVRLLASGGFLLAGDAIFPTRRLDSGFAIVDVGGQKGVRVLQDNREVARTNGRGLAVVSQLRPYEANRIAVASDDLRIDTAITSDSLVVVPRLLGGAYARFGVSRGHAGTVLFALADGKPLPPGSPVLGETGETRALAGMEGEVFLDDLVAGMVLTAVLADGRCSIVVPALPAGEALPRIGPLRCRMEVK